MYVQVFIALLGQKILRVGADMSHKEKFKI